MRGEQGVALVVTLILLAIITFMAITLLVVTRSLKGSVSTTADQTTSSLAADIGTERAKAAIIAPILAFNNPYSIDLLIPTNYYNPHGFFNNNTFPTNVNYDYTVSGARLSAAQQLQNLQNLLYDPRAPVWVTNRIWKSNEFRYYYDWNRNGKFDATGLLPVVNSNGTFLVLTNGVVSNYFTGDPQWIGVLERPGFPHSPTNKFVSRWTYIVVPLSKTMDINYIYDYSKVLNKNMVQGSDSYFRNMGVGTWEINLAAFLVDLNTNIWQPAAAPYTYYGIGNYLRANTGAAFEDALSILRYRYAANWQNSLFTARALLGGGFPNGIVPFETDRVDGYTHGPPMLGTVWNPGTTFDNDQNLVNRGWSGSDNPNHYFTLQDLFDRTKTGMNVPGATFSDRLTNSVVTSNSYDNSTFVRLASQLSTESVPESGKLHLNYVNVDRSGNIVPNMATNLLAWSPAQFFTNAAVRLLRNAGYSVGFAGRNPYSATNILTTDGNITNFSIQIWPTNFYTPSVHRLLQLAANIYDATTNRTFGQLSATNGFPSVFRPIFFNGRNGIFITGYQEVNDDLLVRKAPPIRDLSLSADRGALQPTDMVYGIPLIIGAKKGFPNFNELAMDTTVTVTRKLEFVAPNLRDPKVIKPAQTNLMYVMTISNVFGIEGWNSYSNPYPRNLQMIVATDMRADATNELGTFINYPQVPMVTNFAVAVAVPPNKWAGFVDVNHAQFSFKTPFQPSTSRFAFMTNSTYLHRLGHFVPLTGLFEQNQNPPFALPHWWLNLRTRLRFILVDTSVQPHRIVDYVNLSSADAPVDLTYELTRDGQCPEQNGSYNPPNPVPLGAFWCTNRANPTALTYGVRAQIQVCLGDSGHGGLNVNAPDWLSLLPQYGNLDKNAAIDFFRTNLMGWPAVYSSSPVYLTNRFYAPFNPTRTLHILTSWSANDPLVHYTIGDLLDLQTTNHVQYDPVLAQQKIDNIGRINDRYEPWGGNPLGRSQSPTKVAIQVKDPMVTRSDDWDFPTNKFPHPGWLGRIHRGTPWQTVYLKSAPIDVTNWYQWTGNIQAVTNFGQIDTNIVNVPVTVRFPATNWTYDILWTFPTNDWRILDLFTTAFNDNASRGKLGINQTNLASWSAVLSGVIALQANTNSASLWTNYPVVVQPVGNNGTNSPLWHVWTAINDVRRTNYAGYFRRLGDILAVPELSDSSPYMNLAAVPGAQKLNSVNDAVCERLPQQILGLITLDTTPRFLIYSYGQALKPANRSIVTSGPYFGLCTNYQVMAESATRTLVRIEGVPDNPHVVVEKYNVLPPD